METNNIQQSQTLEEQLSKLQDKWTDIVKELNDNMKTISSLDNLMNDVYTKRQEAIDVYYGTFKILAARTRDYKIKSANLYNNIKSGSNGIRYTNENAITTQIESTLYAEKETIDLLTNFTNFLKETIQTIDNIIYGINAKLKIYEMLNGLKF